MPGPVQVNTDPQLRQPFAAPFIGDDLADPGVDCERIALPASVVDLDVPLVVDGGLERLDDRRYVKVWVSPPIVETSP